MSATICTHRAWLLLAATLFALGCAGTTTEPAQAPTTAPPAAAAPPPPTPAPGDRFARLARTVNVSSWFWLIPSPDPVHLQTYLSDADVDAIHGMGFTAVRLAINPKFLFHVATPNAPDASVLRYLDAALDRLVAHDLAVIVDMQDSEHQFDNNAVAADSFVVFWEALAQRLSHHDPERVFLEVLNEPVFDGHADRWLALQERLLAAMRRGAPAHTLIATGPGWSTIDGLRRVVPVADPNVVYTFHFYDPMPFTHQGASWVSDPYPRLHGVPWAVDDAHCEAAAKAQTDASAANMVYNYCAQKWNAAAIANRFAAVDEWRHRYNVRVLAGEFGATCKGPSDDRARYTRDVRTALEQRGIPWGIWSWEGCFGVGATHLANGSLVVDTNVVRALGLTTGGALASAP
jgi:endoglucanase